MNRWLEETGGTSGAAYESRFQELAATGADVHGEAGFVDALLDRGSQVLDAGCGTGRVAIELARRGHEVLAVDSDDSMLDVARRSAAATWVRQDLADLELSQRFDLVVAAGNVMVFLAAGTEHTVVQRLAAHLHPGGLLVSGWRTDRLAVPTYDRWTAAAGLEQVGRHAAWTGEAWFEGADWCVAVDRARGTAVDRARGTAVDRARGTAVDRAHQDGPHG